jgi:hypothetical protein
VKAVTVNLVIRDSDDVEHVPSVKSILELLTVPFQFTWAKISINYFYIHTSNTVVIEINTRTYTTNDQAAVVICTYTTYDQAVIGIINTCAYTTNDQAAIGIRTYTTYDQAVIGIINTCSTVELQAPSQPFGECIIFFSVPCQYALQTPEFKITLLFHFMSGFFFLQKLSTRCVFCAIRPGSLNKTN